MTWDYLVLDVRARFCTLQRLSFSASRRNMTHSLAFQEGHRLKNPDIQLSQCMHSIPARHRIILTGTPIQNNLLARPQPHSRFGAD